MKKILTLSVAIPCWILLSAFAWGEGKVDVAITNNDSNIWYVKVTDKHCMSFDNPTMKISKGKKILTGKIEGGVFNSCGYARSYFTAHLSQCLGSVCSELGKIKFTQIQVQSGDFTMKFIDSQEPSASKFKHIRMGVCANAAKEITHGKCDFTINPALHNF